MKKKHLQLLLIILKIFAIVNCNRRGDVARTFCDIYMNTKIPQKVSEKMETFTHVPAGEKCPVGMFNDTTIQGTQPTTYNCYTKFKFRDYKKRIRNLATNQYSNIIPCESNNDCYNNIGIDTNCDLKTSFKYCTLGLKKLDGICIQVDTFAYVFTETIKTLPPEMLATMGRVFQPVLYDADFKINVDNCRDEGKGCGNGQFCSAVVGFPEELPVGNVTYFCYFLPKLPDLNIGHKLAATLPNQDLALCRSDPDCTNESDESWSCDLGTGQTFARGIDGKKVVYNGLCVRTPPISVSNADKYINLSVSTTYAQRLQYFPVDFERLSQDKPIKKCSLDSECVEGAFCGEVYDYATKSKKPGVKYCFKSISIPEEESSNTWIIVVVVVAALIVIVAGIAVGVTVFMFMLKKKRNNKGTEGKKDKNKKSKAEDKKGKTKKKKKKTKKEQLSTTIMREEWADVSVM